MLLCLVTQSLYVCFLYYCTVLCVLGWRAIWVVSSWTGTDCHWSRCDGRDLPTAGNVASANFQQFVFCLIFVKLCNSLTVFMSLMTVRMMMMVTRILLILVNWSCFGIELPYTVATLYRPDDILVSQPTLSKHYSVNNNGNYNHNRNTCSSC